MFVVILALYALLSVGGLTLFKLGAQQAMSIGVTGSALSLNISWLSLAGLAMYVCSFLIYMGLVSKIQLDSRRSGRAVPGCVDLDMLRCCCRRAHRPLQRSCRRALRAVRDRAHEHQVIFQME